MKKLDFKEIWKTTSNREISNKIYSAGDIRNYRSKRLRKIKSSISLSILFDIALKSLLLIPSAYLFSSYMDKPSVLTLLATLTGTLIILIAYQTYLLYRHSKIKESDTLFENLKKRYDFYSGAYQGFLFTGSLSSPLFVMTGFLMYLHLKYDVINLSEKFGDLILFTIVIFAWIITLIFQLPVYLFEIKELKTEIMDLDDPQQQIINFAKAERARNIRTILFSFLILAGIITLWLVYSLGTS